jgi:hypothetical protein
MEYGDFTNVISMANRIRCGMETEEDRQAIIEFCAKGTPELTIQVLSEWPELVDGVIARSPEFREWLDSITDLANLEDDTHFGLTEYALKGARCDLIERWCKPNTKNQPESIWFYWRRTDIDWLPLVSVLPLLLDCSTPDNKNLRKMIAHEQLWSLLVPTLTKLSTLTGCAPTPVPIKFLQFVNDNVGNHLAKDTNLVIRELIKQPINDNLMTLIEFVCFDFFAETPIGTIGKLLEAKKLPKNHLQPLADDYSEACQYIIGKPTDSLLFWLFHEKPSKMARPILLELKGPELDF